MDEICIAEARRKVSSLQIQRLKLQRELDAEETLLYERGTSSKQRLNGARKALNGVLCQLNKLLLIVEKKKEKVAQGKARESRSFWEILQAKNRIERF